MKKIIFAFLLSLISVLAAEPYFLTHPSLSPDASFVVFSYEGDIWKAEIATGKSFRLTAMNGRETNPVFSPDGNWIAFSGRQDGNANVYLVNVNGGVVKQLTFNDANDIVENWSWDSKNIIFTSNMYNDNSAYTISITGGTPRRIFSGFFNWPHNIAVVPGKEEYLFNDTWESQGYASRKRYKGDFNPDIKSYNFATKELKILTQYNGKDLWPSVDKSGNLYFASDEVNGEYNLYKYENGKKINLTDFNSSILTPKVNASGGKVVFEKDYQLYLYDVITKKTGKIDLQIFSNNTLALEEEFDVNGKITAFDISPDAKKIVFISRGIIFVSDIEGKFVKQIETDPLERVLEVNWLKDNKTILYTRTVNGWSNLFSIQADKQTKENQITGIKKNCKSIVLNSSKTKALYIAGRDELNLLDISNNKTKTLLKDEFWALYPEPARFSPDDNYVAYAAYRNFEHDIFIYDIKNDKSFNLTQTGVTETSPFWSADGKYIYFESDRFKPSYPTGTNDKEIFRIPLKKYDTDFKSDKVDLLFTETKKDTSKPIVEIDKNDFNKRWESIVTHPLNQGISLVYQKNDETFVFYSSSHDADGNNLWYSKIKPFEKISHQKVSGSANISAIPVFTKDNFYTISAGNIVKFNTSGNKAEKINISFKFRKKLNDEFKQMFYETFTNVDENFYDEKFHGENWEKLKSKYEKYLPFLTSREDLRRITVDMLGELNSSHTGFTSNGEEEKVYHKSRTINTGIIFDNTNPYEVDYIIEKSTADKSGIDIKKGDKLTAVNGIKIEESENRDKYFLSTSLDEEILLAFSRNGKSFEVKLHTQDSRKTRNDLYDERIEQNQTYIDKKSNNRIAYIHMKDMGKEELDNFIIEVTNELQYKDALILDLRYNRGGNVHDGVLSLLSQKPYTQWKYREGKMTIQPNFAPASKPIILLINEQSLSDAEMTAAGFKALKLGKIIGTETYRWLIFTSGGSLVDGSFYRLPSWGCYHLNGEDIEWVGVKPDIYVKQTFEDKMNNKDPQIDKAIEEIMKELK